MSEGVDDEDAMSSHQDSAKECRGVAMSTGMYVVRINMYLSFKG